MNEREMRKLQEMDWRVRFPNRAFCDYRNKAGFAYATRTGQRLTNDVIERERQRREG